MYKHCQAQYLNQNVFLKARACVRVEDIVELHSLLLDTYNNISIILLKFLF